MTAMLSFTLLCPSCNVCRMAFNRGKEAHEERTSKHGRSVLALMEIATLHYIYSIQCPPIRCSLYANIFYTLWIELSWRDVGLYFKSNFAILSKRETYVVAAAAVLNCLARPTSNITVQMNRRSQGNGKSMHYYYIVCVCVCVYFINSYNFFSAEGGSLSYLIWQQTRVFLRWRKRLTIFSP